MIGARLGLGSQKGSGDRGRAKRNACLRTTMITTPIFRCVLCVEHSLAAAFPRGFPELPTRVALCLFLDPTVIRKCSRELAFHMFHKFHMFHV